MASVYDLYIEQGSDFLENIDVTGDYTGFTIRSNALDSTGNTISSIASWVDDSAGEFKLVISDTQTASMSTGVGKYDIEVVDGSGSVRKIIKGRVYVDGEVTV